DDRDRIPGPFATGVRISADRLEDRSRLTVREPICDVDDQQCRILAGRRSATISGRFVDLVIVSGDHITPGQSEDSFSSTPTGRVEDLYIVYKMGSGMRELIAGSGRFVDDVIPDGTLHAAFVRSTLAHAILEGFDLPRPGGDALVHTAGTLRSEARRV